jgi:hypothetical protein
LDYQILALSSNIRNKAAKRRRNKRGKKEEINKERKKVRMGVFKLNIPMYDIFITVTDQAGKRKMVSIRPLVCHTSEKNLSMEFDKTLRGSGITFKHTKFPLPVCFLLVARPKIDFEVLLRLKDWSILAKR